MNGWVGIVNIQQEGKIAEGICLGKASFPQIQVSIGHWMGEGVKGRPKGPIRGRESAHKSDEEGTKSGFLLPSFVMAFGKMGGENGRICPYY
jgi:hypothetical protein